jgi:hypothetical protein
MKTVGPLALVLLFACGPARADVSLSNSSVKSAGPAGAATGGGRVGGETIETAVRIPALPFTDSGNTCAFAHDYDESCPYMSSLSPDVVYSYTPASDELLGISLCNSY